MKKFIAFIAMIAISTATIGCGKTESDKTGDKTGDKTADKTGDKTK